MNIRSRALVGTCIRILFPYPKDACATVTVKLLYRPAIWCSMRHCEKIWNDEPVITDNEYFNISWQGDVNNYTLLSLSECTFPANYLNITGPEILSVKEVAEEMAEIMGKKVVVKCTGTDRSYLNNAEKSFKLYGKPSVTAKKLIRMQAEWTMQGGKELNIPTHFEVGDGKF